MREYIVVMEETRSMYYVVLAKSPEEAKEMATKQELSPSGEVKSERVHVIKAVLNSKG